MKVTDDCDKLTIVVLAAQYFVSHCMEVTYAVDEERGHSPASIEEMIARHLRHCPMRFPPRRRTQILHVWHTELPHPDQPVRGAFNREFAACWD